ncbi:MAG: 2TM domain-containing protein [Salinimicrobium sp.]
METNFEQSTRYEQARKKVRSIRGFYTHLTIYILINLILLFVSTRGEGLWKGLGDPANYFTAFFWGIGLCAHWASVFGANFFFGRNWEEKKIKEYMDKEKANRWE